MSSNSTTNNGSSSGNSTHFQAWRVSRTKTRPFRYVGTETTRELQEQNNDNNKNNNDLVTIRVTHSSLNYKDALSASGNRGVTRSFPHTPGIDAAGTVVGSDGDSALVTGYDLGMNTDGGFGEIIQVPSEWVLSPNPFSGTSGTGSAEAAARLSMVYGTAGLTAGLCVETLLETTQAKPEDGKILVTGASGGVGSIVVEILSRALGFSVVAVSRRARTSVSVAEKLRGLGAEEILCPEDLSLLGSSSSSSSMLLPPNQKHEFAHAIDTLGGAPLVQLLKQIPHGGSVVCCGNAAGLGLENLTVLPFILRGVRLLGIDSVEIPPARKRSIWERLAGPWRCPGIEETVLEIGRHDLQTYLTAMLKGESSGRVVLDHSMTL